MPSYLEQGNGSASSFALAYADRDVTVTRSELGLRLDRTAAMGDTLLTLRGRAAWDALIGGWRPLGKSFLMLQQLVVAVGESCFVRRGNPERKIAGLADLETQIPAISNASAAEKQTSAQSLRRLFTGDYEDRPSVPRVSTCAENRAYDSSTSSQHQSARTRPYL